MESARLACKVTVFWRIVFAGFAMLTLSAKVSTAVENGPAIDSGGSFVPAASQQCVGNALPNARKILAKTMLAPILSQPRRHQFAWQQLSVAWWCRELASRGRMRAPGRSRPSRHSRLECVRRSKAARIDEHLRRVAECGD